MAIEPVVKLIDKDTLVEYNNVNIINFGELKAGDKSTVKNLRLWNNKGGTEDASTMRDVEIMVLDKNNAKLEPIVKDGWLHLKCLTNDAPDNADTALTDTVTLKVKAGGMTTAGEIGGAINDGNPLTVATKKNFADMELYVQIINNVLTATHGDKPFSLAVRYFFT